MVIDIDHCPRCGEYLHDEMGHACPVVIERFSRAAALPTPVTPQSGLVDTEIERPLRGNIRKLLQLLANGYNLKEAAVELKIHHQTAKNYSKFIKNALGADTIAHAVLLGIRKGIVNV